MKWLFLAIAILTEVVATNALKASESFTKLWPSLIVVAGYAVAFFFLSLTLREIQVGTAYAIWSGAGIVLTTIVAAVLFGQKPDLPAIAGMALIICGVIVINVFSKSSLH